MRHVGKKRAMAAAVAMSLLLAGCAGQGSGAGSVAGGGDSVQSGSESGSQGSGNSAQNGSQGGGSSVRGSQTEEEGESVPGEGESRNADLGVVTSKEELRFPLGQQIQSDSFTGAVYITPMIVKDEVYNFPSTNNIIFEPGPEAAGTATAGW